MIIQQKSSSIGNCTRRTNHDVDHLDNLDNLDNLDYLDPNLPLCDVVQDLYRTVLTQQTYHAVDHADYTPPTRQNFIY